MNQIEAQKEITKTEDNIGLMKCRTFRGLDVEYCTGKNY